MIFLIIEGNILYLEKVFDYKELNVPDYMYRYTRVVTEKASGSPFATSHTEVKEVFFSANSDDGAMGRITEKQQLELTSTNFELFRRIL